MSFPPAPDDERWLAGVLARHGAVAGSVHRREGGLLRLTAAHGLPDPVRALVASVPLGKGMAGQAAATGRPFQTCNVQHDPSPVIQPGARTVPAQAAVAIPVLDAEGQAHAVVGFAFARSGDLAPDELAFLERSAAGLPGFPSVPADGP